MKIRHVNIGEIIELKVKGKKMSGASFAKLIGLQRQNVKKTVFEKVSIDTDLLVRISEVLGYDFFREYSPEKDNRNEIDYNITSKYEKQNDDDIQFLKKIIENQQKELDRKQKIIDKQLDTIETLINVSRDTDARAPKKGVG
ncbi:hypothetical protein [Dysgonomonas termitidis]|uniref:HTH cro/C1-type domain-containing protein n=1 Tax=Dysgonomonas termitidis TaxID=1516126 RepID=A0ABV9KV26_9BACT